jgi:hypothetical protein
MHRKEILIRESRMPVHFPVYTNSTPSSPLDWPLGLVLPCRLLPTCKLFLPFDYLLSNPAPLPFAHFVLLAGLFPLQSTSRQRRRLVRDRCCLRDFLPLLYFVVCWVVAIFALQGLFGNISSHDHIRPAVFHNVKCLLESLVRPMLFMPHCDCH